MYLNYQFLLITAEQLIINNGILATIGAQKIWLPIGYLWKLSRIFHFLEDEPCKNIYILDIQNYSYLFLHIGYL